MPRSSGRGRSSVVWEILPTENSQFNYRNERDYSGVRYLRPQVDCARVYYLASNYKGISMYGVRAAMILGLR